MGAKARVHKWHPTYFETTANARHIQNGFTGQKRLPWFHLYAMEQTNLTLICYEEK
jgi:hypothetical protein